MANAHSFLKPFELILDQCCCDIVLDCSFSSDFQPNPELFLQTLLFSYQALTFLAFCLLKEVNGGPGGVQQKLHTFPHFSKRWGKGSDGCCPFSSN